MASKCILYSFIGNSSAVWHVVCFHLVGMQAANCAFVRGANRVVIIDSLQYRLDFIKEKLPKVEIINRKDKKVYMELRNLFPHGPDVAIEAAGFHYVQVIYDLLSFRFGLVNPLLTSLFLSLKGA